MRSRLAVTAMCWLIGACLVWAVSVRRPKKQITYLDFQSKANGKLKENFHGGTAGNNLAELPRGEQRLGGAKFKIGDGLIQLAGKKTEGKPARVEGIDVGQSFARLYILQATGTGYDTADGAVIGQYTIHYADKSTATIDIVFGKDVRDWWYYPNSKGVTGGRVAWEGNNPAAKAGGAKIRLYVSTWTNPHPRKKVTHIDFASTRKTLAAPFCVALSVEGN